MNPILVTGATGTVGSQVVHQLAGAGVRVRALVRGSEKAENIRLRGVETVQGDFADPESLDRALEGIERALLLSAPDPRQAELQGNFIQAAKRARVRYIVKHSALGAGERSLLDIGRLHRQTEAELEKSGIAYTHVRPNFFMQNLANFMGSTIRSQNAFYSPTKDARIAFVDARDVAAAEAMLLQNSSGHEGKTYVLTGPAALTYTEVADKLSAALGRKITYVDITPEQARQSMQQASMPEWAITMSLQLADIAVQGLAEKVTGDVQSITGRKPRTFDSFAADYASTFRPAAAGA